MKKILCLMAILFASLWTSGCTSNRTVLLDTAPLTPAPAKPIDPPDHLVAKAMAQFLETAEAPQSSNYDFRRFDLDNDGRREALVLFKTPYGYWCGMHGCTLLVLKAYDHHFELVNSVQPIREPLYISTAQTNGWKDLIVRVSGRWFKSRDVALQFDGKTYPNNPSDLPEYLHYASKEETRLFYD